MTIQKIRIGSFGKLNNVELDLSEGLNLVQGGNECGKSTIHSFIRAMFFGIELRRGNTYERFLPRDNPGSFQGSLDFEHGGRNYRIRRSFLKSDRICVFSDADTGETIPGAETITDIIPELTESAYKNTVSIEQCGVKPEQGFSRDAGDRIANLATAKSMEVNVSGATAELQKKARELKKDLQSGRKEALEGEQRELLEKCTEIDGYYECRAQLASKIRENDDLRNQLLAEKKLKINRREQIRADIIRRKAEQEKILQSREASDKKQLQESSLQGKENPNEEEKQLLTVQEKRKVCGITFRAGAAAIISGVLLTLIFTDKSRAGVLIAAILLMAGAIAMVAALVLKREIKLMTSQSDESDKDLILQKAEAEEPEEPAKQTEGSEKSGEQTEESGNQPEEPGNQSEEPGNQPEVMKEELNLIEEELELIEEQLEGLAKKRHGYEKELAAVEAKIEVVEDPAGRIDEIRAAIADCEADLAEEKKDLEATELALDAIVGLSEGIYRSFGERLNKKLSLTVEQLTDGKYERAVLQQNMQPLCMERIDYVAADAMSVGAAEQLYFAMRLTLADVFFDKLKAPFILDEPFAYYDEARTEKAIGLLTDCGRQVILFTCRELEGHILDRMGAAYRRFELQ